MDEWLNVYDSLAVLISDLRSFIKKVAPILGTEVERNRYIYSFKMGSTSATIEFEPHRTSVSINTGKKRSHIELDLEHIREAFVNLPHLLKVYDYLIGEVEKVARKERDSYEKVKSKLLPYAVSKEL